MLRKRSIRILLTEKCNASCPNCFNSKIRTAAEFDPDKFEGLCNYLSRSGFSSLKIMGGEPTVNSHFLDLIEISKRYFYGVHIFSNALSDAICDIKLREHDSIIYNMNFSNSLTERKFVLTQPGKRCLKYQLNKDTDIDKLLDSINYFMSFSPKRIYPSFTFDCTYDIFKDRDILLELLDNLEKRLRSLKIKYGFDHKLPVCFVDDKHEISYRTGLCRVETSGLIDVSLNLRYCNQHHESVCSLVDDNGNYIPWGIVKNRLLKYYYEQQLEIMKGPCGDCEKFETECNGGCWGHMLKK